MADCGTITVVPAFDPSLVTTDCTILDADITEGESARVEVSASNGNDVGADVAYSVVVDGSNLTSDAFSVPAGSSNNVTVELTGLSPGDRNVDVTTSVSESA